MWRSESIAVSKAISIKVYSSDSDSVSIWDDLFV